jgi:hypothetical protein
MKTVCSVQWKPNEHRGNKDRLYYVQPYSGCDPSMMHRIIKQYDTNY